MSDDSDINKNLLDAAVVSNINVGGKLTLSGHSGHNFHKIYIRYDYEQIWKKISSSSVTRYIITGSSGIGKSCFIGYIIVQILKSQNYNIIIYSVQREGAWQPDYRVITKDGIKVADNLFIHTLLTTQPIKGLRVMWLMDAMQHGPYQCLNENVTVILFASFSTKNYKDFHKNCGTNPITMYLPWWSQTDEGHLVGLNAEHLDNPSPIEREFLDLVNLYCTDDQSVINFAECWTIAGCNPRNVLKTNSINALKNQISVKAVITPKDLTLLQLAFCSSQHAYITETENFSSKIFCPIIGREDYLPTGNVVYVSQFACNMLTKCFKSKEYNEQIDYLVARCIPEDSSKWGQSFESHMHMFFYHCKKKSFTIMKLKPQYSRPNEGHVTTATLTLPSFNKVKRFTKIEQYLTPDTYYQPYSPRFSSLDSFYLDNSGTLYVFQFTTASFHPIIAQGVHSVVGTNYKKVIMVFVVPSDKYRLPDQKPITNEQSLTNKKTKFYKPLQKDVFKNLSRVITQWKLVVDIAATRNVLL